MQNGKQKLNVLRQAKHTTHPKRRILHLPPRHPVLYYIWKNMQHLLQQEAVCRMKRLSGRMGASFILIGFVGQLAWTIENMYFNVFLYNTISTDPNAIATMVAATAGYAFVTNITELILLSTVQGLAFGIATTAGITLAIDITNATLRSAGNVSFSWMARLGMIIGIVLGVWLYQSYSFKNLLSVSVITGVAGVLMVSGVYVPFRAPIVTRLYSFDRFLLLRGWVPAINMILITFVPGLLIPLVHRFLNDSVLGSSGIPIPFFVGTGIGYLASLLLARLFILKEKTLRLVLVGIILEIVAITLLASGFPVGVPSILLGLGLGLVMPEFLVMIVKLSHHCQRGTANTTHLLASEVGFASGIAVACYFDLEADKMLYTGQVIAVIALIFFILVTYPYYKRKKVR